MQIQAFEVLFFVIPIFASQIHLCPALFSIEKHKNIKP